MPIDYSCCGAHHPLQCPCWRIAQFHLVKTLSDSGIALYHTGIHGRDQESGSKIDFAMVIDNSKDCDSLAVNVITELAKCKSTCPNCLNVIERAQAILNYYDCIKKNNILAICSDCAAMRRKAPSCAKCDDLTQQFLAWKRRYVEGIAEPGDSNLWLKQIDETLQSMKEPQIRKKRLYTDKDFYTIDKDKKKAFHENDILLQSKASKVRSSTDLGGTQIFEKKSKDEQDKGKELRAKSSDDLEAMSRSEQVKKRMAKAGDEDSTMKISKSGQTLRKETKKSHDQFASKSDSDTVDVYDKNKFSKKTGKKTLTKLKPESFSSSVPIFDTSTDRKTLFGEKIDHLQTISGSASKKRGAKKGDKDFTMATTKSGQMSGKVTKKHHGQVSSISDSDSVDEDDNNKLPKKTGPKTLNKTKNRALKSMKSTDLGPQASIDLELVKHRKLRKHHSLDTFLTSMDKKQKKAKNNFAYLFPEELKKKSKSSVGTDGENNLAKKDTKKYKSDGDLDDKSDRTSTKQSKDKEKHYVTEEDQSNKTSAKQSKAKVKQYGTEDDLSNRTGTKQSKGKGKQYGTEDDPSNRTSTKQSKGKGKQYGTENDQSNRTSTKQSMGKDKKYDIEDEQSNKIGTKQSKGKDKQYGTENNQSNRTSTKQSMGKDKQYGTENDQSNKRLNKDQAKQQGGKPDGLSQADKIKQKSKNDTEYSNMKNKHIQPDHKSANKDKKQEIANADTSKQSKGKYGSKDNKSNETGKRDKNREPGSNLEQSVKPAKHGKSKNENEFKLDDVTGEAKGGKGKNKSDSKQERGSKSIKRGINEDEPDFKHDPSTKASKRGKGDEDFNSKQDQGDEVGQRGKGKGIGDGKEDAYRGQGETKGDTGQKGFKGKNKVERDERDTGGKNEPKTLVTADSAKKDDIELSNQKRKAGAGKAGEGGIWDLMKKGDIGKGKDGIQGRKKKDYVDGSTKIGGDRKKLKTQTGASEVLFKQIRAKRSTLDNKIAGLVSVKEKKINKQRNLSTDISQLLKKKIESKVTESDDDQFEAVYCDEKAESTREFIVGETITDIKPALEEKDIELKPLLFSTKVDHDDVEKPINTVHRSWSDPKISIADKDETAGITHYVLSDRQFIDMGWTMLPTEKVVRKMNVYRMRPAHPEFDWFERNKSKQNLFYDTGEKMADFDEDGHVRWFYRNGRLALDYYAAEEVNAQQRFVIYGNGETDHRGRSRPVAVLAMFDYLGNGVVFDNAGKTRLKYNQTEGVIMDKSLGPVSHWKWHSLNDPPVLQQVMIDTHLQHKDPNILNMAGKTENTPRPENEDMLAIEFDNFIKEKSKKLAQTFKPFQIKMKALKINEYFSLRILDQASVYLIYRDGTTNIKLNIGMLLDHKEIVDTDTAELGDVSNSIERFPARTGSLEGIQRSVAHAQRVEAARVGLERRLQPPVPVASADRLAAATSKPLRSKLRTVPSMNYSPYVASRKNTCPNFYYESRII